MSEPRERSIPGRLTEMFLTFVVFAIIGWIYEVCILWIEMHHGFVNRGFLYGPWLPIYGFGGLLVVLLFGRLARRKLPVCGKWLTPIVCFLAICLLATVVELGASYLTEWATGYRLWDYSVGGFGIHYQGRIALRSSLQFGVIGTVVLYAVYPPLTKGLRHLRLRCPWVFRICSAVIFAVFMYDVVYHLIHGSNATW